MYRIKFNVNRFHNLILLRPNSPLFDYTFIQSNLKQVHQTLINSPIIQQKPIYQYSQLLTQKQVTKSIRNICQKDITASQLLNIYQNNSSKNNQPNNLLVSNANKSQTISLDKNRVQSNFQLIHINKVAESFAIVKNYFLQNINCQNLHVYVKYANVMNIIHFQLWQKIHKIIADNYKNQIFQIRQKWISTILGYHRKIINQQLIHKQAPYYKFYIKSKYVNDLINFKYFVKNIQTNNDYFFNQQQTLQNQNLKYQKNIKNKMHLGNLTKLIIKLSKQCNIDIFNLRKQFTQQRLSFIINQFSNQTLDQKQFNQMMNIYMYVVFLNHQINYMPIEAIISNYVKLMQPNQKLSKVNQKIFVSKILHIWKYQGRYNEQIYNSMVQPFLKIYINKNYNFKYFGQICLNLICSSFNDDSYKKIKVIQMVTNIVTKYQSQNLNDDKQMSIVKHYLNIHNNKLIYKTNYKSKQNQNQTLLKFLSKKSIPFYSTNLINPQFNSKANKQLYTQYNQVERFWQDSLDRIINSKNWYRNCMFDQFEIDCLIIGKDDIIAVEIQGSHYNCNNQHTIQNDNQPLPGKKKLKQYILESYGIKIIRVKCYQKDQVSIKLKSNIKDGGQLIKKKIEQKLQKSISEIIQ